jgi:dienelactone hydrolase
MRRRLSGWARGARAQYLSPAFSADGSQLSYVSDRDGASRLWLRDLASGRVRPLSPRDLHVDKAVPSPTAGIVAVIARRRGRTGSGIFLVSWTGRVQDVLWGPEGAELGGWSRDGARLWVAAAMTSSGALDACAVDVATGAVRLVLATDGIGMVVDDDPGRGLLLVETSADGVAARAAVILDDRSGKRVWSPPERPDDGHIGPLVFTADGFLAISNSAREFSALVEFSSGPAGEDRPRTVRERPQADLDGAVTSRDRATLLLAWNCRGRSELELVSADGASADDLGPLPAETAWGTDMSGDGHALAATFTGASQAPSVWRWTRDTGRWSPVAPARRTGAGPRLAAPALVRMAARDGLPLDGWYYPARGPRSRGCAIALHGGPAAQACLEYDPSLESLREAGIAVLAPNVRGSRGYGRTFMRLDDGGGRFAARSDVVDVARHAIAQGYAEPGTLGALGWSAGGYYAICALLDAPDLFAAGVSISGVVEPAWYVRETEAWRRPGAVAEFGDPGADGELLTALSPFAALHRIGAPLLLIHGGRDTVVPPAGAVHLAARMTSMGRPVSLRLLPDEGHSFTTSAAAGAARRLTRRWFLRHFKGGGDRTGSAALAHGGT